MSAGKKAEYTKLLKEYERKMLKSAKKNAGNNGAKGGPTDGPKIRG